MVADPRHSRLICEHCGHHEPLEDQPRREAQDVGAALWSVKGRLVPRTATVFACGGCGASFLAQSERLSSTCPYCSVVYVASAPVDRDLIEPHGVVPFIVTSGEAERALALAGVTRPHSTLRGLYAPAWLFSFSGEVAWWGSQRDGSGFGSNRREEVSGTYTIVEARTCVPAGRHSPAAFETSMLGEFDWQAIVSYRPELVASWPAETYQISLDEATVAGRRAVMPSLRAEVQEGIDSGIDDLHMSFARVAADSYQLVLVPLWVVEGDPAADAVPLFVNGQSGATYVPEEPGIATWLSGLLRPRS
jgi:hypothetical protein